MDLVLVEAVGMGRFDVACGVGEVWAGHNIEAARAVETRERIVRMGAV